MTNKSQIVTWGELEQLFLQLQNKAVDLFAPSELEEVMSFVRANEFGLPLETFIDICGEERKPVPGEVQKLLAEIASKMGNASSLGSR
jgi:hypothetical protein